MSKRQLQGLIKQREKIVATIFRLANSGLHLRFFNFDLKLTLTDWCKLKTTYTVRTDWEVGSTVANTSIMNITKQRYRTASRCYFTTVVCAELVTCTLGLKMLLIFWKENIRGVKRQGVGRPSI